jgi:uncharacterized protein (UPF0335 family)
LAPAPPGAAALGRLVYRLAPDMGKKTLTARGFIQGVAWVGGIGYVPGLAFERNWTMAKANDKGGITGERLKSFIERVERLEEEKAALAADIKDVYAEAKSAGFDVKIVRQIIRIRKSDPQDRREQEELLELYMAAIGME